MVPVTRAIRDNAIRELVAFIDSKLDSTTTAILAGDFNIMRLPFKKYYRERLLDHQPALSEHLHLIDKEYDELVTSL